MSASTNSISTHVLDTSLGKPAAGVVVILERVEDDLAMMVGSGTTDENGRVSDLLSTGGGTLDAGTYRLRFATRTYFENADRETFFPEVAITFRVTRGPQHYHVPLLLSPYGFTTYRGS